MSSESDPPDTLARLDDYVVGVMRDDEAETFEEAFFEAAASSGEGGADLALLDRLVRVGRHLDARHTFAPGATRAQVDAMLASGRRVAFVDLGRGEVPEVRYPRSADQLVLRLEVELEGVDQVDVEIALPDGETLKTLRDLPFEASDGAIYACCEMPLALISAEVPSTWRIVGVRGGRRRTLAELTIPTVLTD